MTPQIITQTSVATAQNGFKVNNSKLADFSNPNRLSPEDQLILANTPDKLLDEIAKQQAYDQYNNSSTRKATRVVGNSIPFIHTFLAGAFHKGSASAKLAKSASTGADWGFFAGTVWLYNKALGKIYDTFPRARKFRDDHPTAAYIGEVGSAVYISRKAIKGFHAIIRKLSNGKKPMQIVQEFMEKRPNLAEKLAKVFKPVTNLIEKYPALKGYAKLGAAVTMLGLMAKDLYDVSKIRKNSGKNIEQLKDRRYQIAKNLANQYNA